MACYGKTVFTEINHKTHKESIINHLIKIHKCVKQYTTIIIGILTQHWQCLLANVMHDWNKGAPFDPTCQGALADDRYMPANITLTDTRGKGYTEVDCKHPALCLSLPVIRLVSSY